MENSALQCVLAEKILSIPAPAIEERPYQDNDGRPLKSSVQLQATGASKSVGFRQLQHTHH
jgi:hypothetical protein